MLDSGFMPNCFLRLSDRNMHGGGCAVATRKKIAVFLFTDENYCLHYMLFLMQLSAAHKQSLRCYNLIPRDCWITFLRWTIRYGCMLDSDPYMFDVMRTMLEPVNYISSY